MEKRHHKIRVSPSLVFACFILAFFGCGVIATTQIQTGSVCVICEHEHCDQPLEITYLGAAAIKIVYGEDMLLLSPFFSRPKWYQLAFSRLESNWAAVDPVATANSFSETDAIFLGHGHYDHALDIPYIASEYATHAKIYGNSTTLNMLSGAFDLNTAGRLVNASNGATDLSVQSEQMDIRQTVQIEGTNHIKYLAIPSRHTPHILGITFFDGEIDTPSSELPERFFDWESGHNISFLFEFMDKTNKHVAYRVYYLDSVLNARVEAHRDSFNIVIPTVAQFQNVAGQPESMLQMLNPDYVILNHWDDFTRPVTEQPEFINAAINTNIPEYISRLENSPSGSIKWSLPSYGASTIFGSKSALAHTRCTYK